MRRQPKKGQPKTERKKKMKVELKDDVQALSVAEVVEQLKSCGALNLEDGERVKDARLECGCDLEVDIEQVIEDDPRCSGYDTRTETFSEADIMSYFVNAEYVFWAKDEDGVDVLLCFGAC